MSNNDNTLPAGVQGKIEDFKSAQTLFFDWKGKFSDLLDKAKNQTALAEAAETEAEQHQEALRNLVRDLVRAESGNKDEVNTLSAKLETARSLAAEHRSFAADLNAEAESLKNQGLIAAQDYYDTQKKALASYADHQFEAILNSIDEQLLRAIALKAWSYRIVGNNPGEGTLIHTAINSIGSHFKNRLSGYELDKTTDETIAMLAPQINIKPFTKLDFSDPLYMARMRQKLKMDQEQGAA
jgi:hypothetical protein